MQNGYIIIVYEDDGREVEGQCSGLAKFVGAGLAHPKTEADEECLMGYLEGLGDDDITALKADIGRHGRKVQKPKPDIAPVEDEDEEPEDPVDEPDIKPADGESDDETSPETTTDDPKDGWPKGVTVDQKGSYYDLTGSDGKRIESDAPSGKWQGENPAQEAAWAYENALTGGDSDDAE